MLNKIRALKEYNCVSLQELEINVSLNVFKEVKYFVNVFLEEDVLCS